MKIKTYGNKEVEQEILEDFKAAGKVRFKSSGTLVVTSYVTTSDSQVESPYSIIDNEVLNVFVAFDLGAVILTPQIERERIIPLPLEQFAFYMDEYAEWKLNNPTDPGGEGFEMITWHDPMLPLEFE